MENKLNVTKIIDQFAWAYYFVAKEQQRYTIHNITYQKHDNVKLKNVDILYLHSPDISNIVKNELPILAKNKNIKVIAGYGGQLLGCYSYADLIVSISFPHIKQLEKIYKGVPIVFLPESVDTDFFKPKKHHSKNKFVVGWAGGAHKKIKRSYLFDQFNYPITIQSEWGKKYFKDNSNLNKMKKFYHSIDVLILASQSECMPRVVLEAMATGLPVVSTDVGNLKMLIDKKWLIPNNISDKEIVKLFNEKLSLLKKYKSLRKETGERNLKHVQKYFSWKKNQSIWDSVFSYLKNNEIEKIIKITNKFIKPFESLYIIKEIKEQPKIIERKKQITIPISELESKIKNKSSVEHVINKKNISFINLKNKKVILYSNTPMYGDMWAMYKNLKDKKIEVTLIQIQNKYNEIDCFPFQYLWKKSKNEKCIDLIKQSNVVIFVQYYNQEIMNLCKNKKKVGLFIGNKLVPGMDSLKNNCDILLTTRKELYPFAHKIETIEDLI